MRRFLLVAWLALILLIPAVGAETWPQSSHDAARTGYSPDPGPATNDTAFQVRLPGLPASPFFGGLYGEPLIVDDQVYAPVSPTPGDDELDGQGIARVDLTTAEVEMLVETDEAPQHIASGQDLLFVPTTSGMTAYDLATGQEAWRAPTPEAGAMEPAGASCFAPAVRGALIVTPCTVFDAVGHPDGEPTRAIAVIWALDAATGDELWTRVLGDPEDAEPALDSNDPVQDSSHAKNFGAAMGVTLTSDYAVALSFEVRGGMSRCQGAEETGVCGFASETRIRLWGLDVTEEGRILWDNSTAAYKDHAAWFWTPVHGEYQEIKDVLPPTSPRVTAAPDGVVYAKLDSKLLAINPSQGRTLWEQPLGEAHARGDVRGTSSAYRDGALFATSTESVYRFDVDTQAEAWRVPADPGLDEKTSWGSLMVADDVLYVMTNGDGYGALHAIGTDQGERLWHKQLDPTTERGRSSLTPYTYALGDGVIAAQGVDGWLHVIGQSSASLEPLAEMSTLYPPVDEPVTVDLSGSQPGVHGNATRFKAVWGDGNTTGWQSSPVMNHTYTKAGDVTATFLVANDANQTARTTQVLHVGEQAPAEPNWLSDRFAPENQDMTFGVLGLLVALTGGAIGVGRRYRKRSRLQEELEALEAGFEETKSNPGECEAFLDNRKARARSLLLDGVLTEEQFGVIEGRVAELHRELRTTVLDTRFQFLPHGMVGSIKKMLADGRLTAWEREALEDLLDREEALSQAQKDQVRAQLDRWFGDDAGLADAGTDDASRG